MSDYQSGWDEREQFESDAKEDREELERDLRLHKQERLRLRAENLRLTRERDEARAEVARWRPPPDRMTTGELWERMRLALAEGALVEFSPAEIVELLAERAGRAA